MLGALGPWLTDGLLVLAAGLGALLSGRFLR